MFLLTYCLDGEGGGLGRLLLELLVFLHALALFAHPASCAVSRKGHALQKRGPCHYTRETRAVQSTVKGRALLVTITIQNYQHGGKRSAIRAG